MTAFKFLTIFLLFFSKSLFTRHTKKSVVWFLVSTKFRYVSGCVLVIFIKILSKKCLQPLLSTQNYSDNEAVVKISGGYASFIDGACTLLLCHDCAHALAS